MKKFFGKRSVAVLTAFVMMLSIVSLPTGTALAAVDETFTADGIIYKVLTESGTTGTAEVIADSEHNLVAVTIPETVDSGGVTYTVTSIGDNAFFNCDILGSVRIPDSVTSIGASAFVWCVALGNVIIPSGVTSIGDNAFSACYGLTNIVFSRSAPPSFGSGVFDDVYYLRVIVPHGAASAYEAALSGKLMADAQIIETVDTAAIPGVAAPVRGESPAAAITETEQYTGTIEWSPADDPFEPNTIYTATITLTPKTGYTLTGVPANFFTVAGADSVSNAANSGVITAVFPATEMATQVVDMAAIPGVTVPVKGAIPVSAITETDQYTGTVSWAASDDTFAASTVYTATITLTPKDGYTLTGVSANFFTVAGAETVSNAADSGVITAVFPATGVGIGGNILTGGIMYKVLTESGTTGTAEVIANGYSGAKTIPATVNNGSFTYTVTSIGASAFSGCLNLTSISLPGSLTSIGTSAFSGCTSLTGISIPGSVTSIGNNAFYGCSSLTSVSIPSGVTSISNYLFEDCDSLTSVSIPDSVTSIGTDAFYSCNSLASVTIPADVTSIQSSAFSYCINLRSIVFKGSTPPTFPYSLFGQVPSGLKVVIPRDALSAYVTALSGKLLANSQMIFSVDIAAVPGVTAPVRSAVPAAAVTETEQYTGTIVWVPTASSFDGNTTYTATITLTAKAGNTFIGVPANFFTVAGADSVSNAANSGVITAVFSATLPNVAVDIGDIPGVTPPVRGAVPATAITETEQYTGTIAWAPAGNPFAGNTVYTATITLVRKPGYTFTGVPANFFTVTGAVSVGNAADSGVITAIFPVTATEIGDTIAAGGIKYKVLTKSGAAGTAEVIANNYSGAVTIPETVDNAGVTYTVVSIGANSFSFCSSLTSIGIPGTVTSIGANSFSYCSGLTSVSIPGTVTSIGTNAFQGCSGLTSVSIPGSVASIGGGAFEGCSGLTSVSIPSGVTSIGNYVFRNCSNLTSVSIPGSITSIGASAFYQCNGIASISIPAGVTSIQSSAFGYCINLRSIVFKGSTPPSFDSGVFSNVPAGLKVIVPNGAVPAYTAALAGKLPSSATIIVSVDIAAVPGVTAPVSGTVPVTVITATDQYTGTVSWAPAVNPYATNTIYTATITLTPKAGYTFTGVPANFFTVAGAASVGNAANSGVITAVFPATEAAPQVVNIAAIPGVTAPVSGAVPVSAITETDQYTGTISWAPSDDPFEVNTVYTATITLTPKGDYTFAGVAENFFTVSGADSVGNAANSGVITAVFPAAKVEPGHTFLYNGILYRVLTQSGTTGTVEVTADNYSGAITIPETVGEAGVTYAVTSIGYAAFANCSGLTSISIPDSLISIGDYAFDYCSGLESISIPDGVTSIGEGAFAFCSGLTSVSIPGSVTSIEYAAFTGCSSLTSISIPGSVTSIGESAFNYCSSLSYITFLSSTPPLFGNGLFGSVPAGLQVIVPHGVTSVYATALDGKLPAGAQIVETVDIAAIPGVTVPVSGAVPVSSITETPQYSGTVSWAPADDTFAGSTVYTATITLTPKAVFTFTGAPENFFTVAGADTVSNAADSGVITAVFPATAVDPVLPKHHLSSLTVIGLSMFGDEEPLELSPAFDPEITNYTLELHTDMIEVSAEAEDPTSSVTFKYFDYSESGWYLYNFYPGQARLVRIVVTAEDGTTQRYDIIATWDPSSDSSLKNLSVSYDGTTLPLDQEFDPEVFNYTLTVHNWVDTVDILAETNNQYASCWGNGENYLDYGENTINVFVGAENYEDYSVYTITVTRLEDKTTYTTNDGFVYEDRGSFIAILDYEGTAADITIPAELTNPDTSETKPVAVIASGAFIENSTITSVVLQSGITRIGSGAFSGCPNLQSITLPEGLISIGAFAFSDCKSLESAALPEGLDKVGDFAFADCVQLESVTFPNGIIRIGDYTFSGCESLGNISLPDSLEELGYGAFSGCSSFTSFTLPEKIENIDSPFLEGCTGLETISAGTNTHYKVVDGALLSADGTELIKYPSAKPGAEYIIPDGVEYIWWGAFESCIFESVTIPDEVTEVTWYAFENCKNLNSVTFPDSLDIIDSCAFYNCTGLESIKLPRGLEEIYGDAFEGCTSLTSILVDNLNFNFKSDGGVLYTYDMDVLVIFPAGKGTSFTVPLFVSEIAPYAFCSSQITSINLGNVSYIDCDAFYNCNGLTSVVIPNSVDFIDDWAFESCRNLSSVTIGTGLDYMGSYAFVDCPKLAAVYFLSNAPDFYEGEGEALSHYSGKTLSNDKSKTSAHDEIKALYDDEYDVFPGCSPYLTIYYASGRTGFSNPWCGYPAVKFYPSYKCTVKYSLSGAPGAISDSIVYKYGKAVQPLDPVWAGHKFLGWFKEASCVTPWSFGKNTVTSNITLYAGWTQPDNAYLESLTAVYESMDDEGYTDTLVFNREFNPSVFSYTAKLGEYEDSFKVTAMPAYEGAIVSIDGAPATSKTYAVQNGATVTSTITVTLGAQTHTYTLAVTRAKSNNFYLSDIIYSSGVTVTQLNPYSQAQNVRMDEYTPTVTITPVKEDPLSKVYIGGIAADSRTYAVDTGGQATCIIKVVSQAGNANYYKINITRDKSTNAFLTNIKTNYTNYKITPEFSSGNTVYTVYLPATVSSVTLYPVKADKFASTKFICGTSSYIASYKTFSVAYGTQKDITIRVTPQDTAYPAKDYTVSIIRAPKIYSFSATPRPGTYAELSPGGDNVMTFKWTQYGDGMVTIQVNDGTDWYAVYSGVNTAGTHTATWDGRIEGIPLAPNNYKARISVSNLGTPPVFKEITFKIKPSPTLTFTASPVSFKAGGTKYTKLTVRWDVVTSIKIEVYDSTNTLVTTLWSPASYQYANTKTIYWYGKNLSTGLTLPPGDYTIIVTAGASTAIAAVTLTS